MKTPRKTNIVYGNQVSLGTINGLPVYDAESDMRVSIFFEDTQRAVKADPGKCVFAEACRRQFGTQSMAFNRTTAYVEITDDKGEHRYERFVLDAAAQQLIADFDKGGNPSDLVGRSYVLRKPLPSKTLKYQREARRQKFLRRREAALKGEVVETKTTPSRPGHKQLSHADLQVRDGRGMVAMRTPA